MYLMNDALAEDHQLKHQKLVFEFKVVANASPSLKQHLTDIPGTTVLGTEEKTSDIAAIEDITGLTNYAAPNDSAGDMLVLINAANVGTINKVLKTNIQLKSGGSQSDITSNSILVYDTEATGLTTDGNIAMVVGGLGDMSSSDQVVVCAVDLLLKK